MSQQDDKRFYRELKRQVKKAGNKKVRRELKNVLDDNPDEAHIIDFDYGHNESAALNGRDGQNRKRKEKGNEREQRDTDRGTD